MAQDRLLSGHLSASPCSISASKEVAFRHQAVLGSAVVQLFMIHERIFAARTQILHIVNVERSSWERGTDERRLCVRVDALGVIQAVGLRILTENGCQMVWCLPNAHQLNVTGVLL